MALSSVRELFVFELGRLRDMEERAGQLLARLGDNVRDDELKRTLHAHEHESHVQVRNINACLECLGSSPVETTSYVVEAIRNSYQEFIGLNPSPRVLELLMVELACWYADHATTRYRGLFNIAISLDEHECGRLIVANRSAKEAFIGRLRQFSVALTQQETVRECDI